MRIVNEVQAAFCKECLSCCQHSGQIPGEKVQISVAQAGGPTQEDDSVLSCLPQVIPEIQHGLAELLCR